MWRWGSPGQLAPLLSTQLHCKGGAMAKNQNDVAGFDRPVQRRGLWLARPLPL